jgi:hypothetical protein
VEIRQHKRRPPSESPSTSWVDAKLAPVSNEQQPHRIAAAAFKTVDASAPVGVAPPPSGRSGRILPSLEAPPPPVEIELAETLEPVAKSRMTRKRRVASPVRSIDISEAPRPVRAPITATRPETRVVVETRRDAAAVRPANGLTKLRAKLEKHSRVALREAEAKPAPVAVVQAPPARAEAGEQVASRKRPILARYVLRGEGEPGQGWKRKLLARRESRT